ncbi:cold shock-like protein CspD [Salmonella enterica subsp. enterica serovar Newport str. A182RVB]|nr:cold shock-like protein CspD [Salmonella enterica subsp. enterica serovar Newport str. A182RVB]
MSKHGNGYCKVVQQCQRVWFICPEGGGEDIFAHYSTIQMDGYRTLKAGQSVRFDVHQGPKGNHASVIVPIEAEAVA